MQNSFLLPLWAALVIGLMLAPLNLPAPDLRPPLQELRDPAYTLVVARRTNAPVMDRRMEFEVLERLKGNPDVPDLVKLLVLQSDEREIEIGETYLVFFSDIVRDSRKPKKQVHQLDRAQLAHVEGAAPAVFPNTYAMRTLLTPGHSNVELDPQYAAVVMQGMQSGDPIMVDLWSAEWALRPVTFGPVSQEDVTILDEIITDPGMKPAARARVLLTGAERSTSEVGTWFVESANQVLEAVNPAQLSEKTGLSPVIYASLRVARDFPRDTATPLLEKWLRASPPLAENAALALRAINPELEREAVGSAIEDQATPEPTRVFLNDHLRRLDLAEQRR